MLPIYFNPQYLIAAAVSLAGAAGIGYSVNAKIKKQKSLSEQVNSSEKTKLTVDVVNTTTYEVVGQADAAVVDAINALRIKRLLDELSKINRNKAGATEEIKMLKSEIQKILASNRGGVTGIHGFIGETSQVHISNVKAFINGDEPLYILLDDNSMTDYIRGIELIQQKACQAGGNLGLDAIKRHNAKYPEFVKNGGIYQIPKDMHARYEYLRKMPEEVAMKLRKEDLRQWRYIHNFTAENPEVVVEPMEVSYSDIQSGNINNTIRRVEDETENEFNKQTKAAHEEHLPSIEEFLKVCGISAAIEGGIGAGTEFIGKLKRGQKLREFTRQDFRDIGVKFVIDSGKGALRGGVVYIATNLYKIPAAIISGIVTALFGICREGYLWFKKRLTKEQFAKNSLFIVFETVASTGGASLGKHICKSHPVIGALAGSVLGSVSAGWFRKTVFA